jgi:hemerythrin-like domain-containing protein
MSFERGRLRRLLSEEERGLVPLLDSHLPAEVAGSAIFRREHDTLRALLDRLRELAPSVGRSRDATLDARVVVDDLALLLHQHIRREDSVLNPLLERLEARRVH